MRRIGSLFVLLVLFLVVLFAAGAKAQKKQLQIETTELTDDSICSVKDGDPSIGHAKITGWIVKRNFNEDEETLHDVVLKDAKDRRTTVNFDVEFLKGYRWVAPDLANALLAGTYVRFDVDQCGRIYIARRLKVLKG